MIKSSYLLPRLVLPCLLVLMIIFPVEACTTCNRPLQAAIFDASFTKLFFFMLLPFAVVGLIVHRLHKLK